MKRKLYPRIETGIAPRTCRAYLFDVMQVGDSVFIDRQPYVVRASAWHYMKKHPGVRISCRTELNGCRYFRLA